MTISFIAMNGSLILGYFFFLVQSKLQELERMASYRKSKLNDNSAFLQFNWKADVVESWIGKNTLG